MITRVATVNILPFEPLREARRGKPALLYDAKEIMDDLNN
jgi:hypothetical protein